MKPWLLSDSDSSFRINTLCLPLPRKGLKIMVHPMRFSPILFSVFSLLAVGVCFSPAPAQAGFQWVSPSDTSGATVIVPDAMPATRSSKAAPEMEIISPLVIEGTTPATSLPSNTLSTNTLAAPAPVAPPPAPSAFSSEQPIDLMPAKNHLLMRLYDESIREMGHPTRIL